MTDADSLLVFNTGFTVDLDGPGQRLVIYLKGCNMRCLWCAAPESVSPHPDVLFFPHRLDDPTRAVAACSQGAIAVRDGDVSRDLSVCYRCEELACLRGGLRAFERMGERIPISDLVEKARRYRMFYGPTGGATPGTTGSGTTRRPTPASSASARTRRPCPSRRSRPTS